MCMTCTKYHHKQSFLSKALWLLSGIWHLADSKRSCFLSFHEGSHNMFFFCFSFLKKKIPWMQTLSMLTLLLAWEGCRQKQPVATTTWSFHGFPHMKHGQLRSLECMTELEETTTENWTQASTVVGFFSGSLHDHTVSLTIHGSLGWHVCANFACVCVRVWYQSGRSPNANSCTKQTSGVKLNSVSR